MKLSLPYEIKKRSLRELDLILQFYFLDTGTVPKFKPRKLKRWVK